MNLDNNYSQGQFEFFTPPSRGPQANGKRQLIFRSLNVSVDNLIISGILLVMALLLIFSIGVERGKRLVSVQKNPVQNTQNSVSLQNSLAPVVTEIQNISLPPDDGPVIAVDTPSEIAVPRASALDEGYTVQIATYKGEKHARDVVQQLQKLGHESFFLSKGDYVIVCVGKFSAKDEAKKYAVELKKKYKDCYVRRI